MKEVLQVAYLRRLQDFYLFESVKDGIIHCLPFFAYAVLTHRKFCARIELNFFANSFAAHFAIHTRSI